MAMRGELVFLRIFDLGGTIEMQKARACLGDWVEGGALHPTRAAPEYVTFTAPIGLSMSPLGLDIESESGKPAVLRARLYEVGALAVMLRVPVGGETLAELQPCLQQGFRINGRAVKRWEVHQSVFDSIRPKILPAVDEIFDTPVEPESYTVFCMTEVPGGAEKAWQCERNRIAALLIGEAFPEKLSKEEVDELLRNWSRYYRDDLLIADWDAAFVVEPSGQYEDVLYICEVANLELMVLRKYDHYLDQVLDRIYAEYERLFKGPPIYSRRAREMLRELGEVRVDLAKVQDELANTTKFIGDWYAARLYMGLGGKLHISEYQQSVALKLNTLRDFYQSVLSEIGRRQNVALEVMIVLLIVFEIVMAFWKP